MAYFPSFLVADSLIRPLVYVPDDCLGLLLHPGSTIPPRQLRPGWHYHWPLLSVIRVYQFKPVQYVIAESQKLPDMGDEPVVAVTQDHRLMLITGQFDIQLSGQSSPEHIQTLGRQSLSRLIRPTIRQAIRQAVAIYTVDQLKAGQDISGSLQVELDQTFSSLPLTIHVRHQPSVGLYKNAFTSSHQT